MNDLDIGAIYMGERQWMSRLLSTMVEASRGLKSRLLLVDNASEDGVDAYKNYFPTTHVIHNWRRLCYGANLNRVLEASTARYILLLNTDLYFDPQEPCVTKMVEFMDRNPQCGLSCCRIYRPGDQEAYAARRFQTLPMILARRCGLGGLLHAALDRYFYRERDIQGSWECDWVSGCFMLVRREAYQQVGGFDTQFIKYFEDLDYCLRIAQAGWQVMYHGATYCYHLEARGSARVFSRDAAHHLRSYLYWLHKWGTSPARHIPERALCRHAA